MWFSKKFDPNIESQIYDMWLANNCFTPDNSSDRSPFTIVMPPPNLTWVLHLGHSLMVAVEDAFVRYHRMIWDNTLWIPWTDHAGIATQVQVEKKLKNENNLTKHDIGRVEFTNKTREYVIQQRDSILAQIRKLGSSVDRSRENFTLSEKLSRAVRASFSNLYNDWKIYLGNRITNRCTRCQTVLSDAEVDMKPTLSKLYTIRYFVSWGRENYIEVQTTRPETIFWDLAIAVHPADKRYKQYIGREVLVPVINRKIPVIADEAVDRAFGTWALKITPAHDPLDFDIWERHGLALDFYAIDKNGNRTNNAWPDYAGLEVEKYYSNFIDTLTDIGNLMEVKDYENSNPYCHRCGTKIQPMTSEQWFVDMSEYARLALEKIDNQDIQVFPERFVDIFHQWLDNIKPWCISRQLWRWHNIPIWLNNQWDMVCVSEDIVLDYFNKSDRSNKSDHIILSLIIFNLIADNKLNTTFEFEDLVELLTKECLVKSDGKIYQVYHNAYKIKFAWDKKLLSQNDSLHDILSNIDNTKDIDKNLWELIDMLSESFCISKNDQVFIRDIEKMTWYRWLKQHSDVLDTWFSSALWPFSTLGRPDKTQDLSKFFPTTLIETWYDILFNRVARMIMMSIANTGHIPFKYIYFHGTVRDEKWAKMSKSKWNGIDPLAMIDKYNTDALRLSLVANATPGNDTNFSEQKIDYFYRFTTKLRNASRFVCMQTLWEDSDVKIDYDIIRDHIISNSTDLNDFDLWIINVLDDMVQESHKAFWSYQIWQYADKLVKFVWNYFCDWYIEICKIEKSSMSDQVLLYTVGTVAKLLHPYAPYITEQIRISMWFDGILTTSAYPDMSWLGWLSTQTRLFLDIISEFRDIKKELDYNPTEKIDIVIKWNTNILNMIWRYEDIFKKLIYVNNILLLPSISNQSLDEYQTRVIFDMTVGIKWHKVIDVKEQISLLTVDIEKEKKFLNDLQTLLTSEWFLSSAPEQVVTTKRAKFDEIKTKIKTMETELERLKFYQNQ